MTLRLPQDLNWPFIGLLAYGTGCWLVAIFTSGFLSIDITVPQRGAYAWVYSLGAIHLTTKGVLGYILGILLVCLPLLTLVVK